MALGLLGAFIVSACAFAPLEAGELLRAREKGLNLSRARGYEGLVVEFEAVLDSPGIYRVTPSIQLDQRCGADWPARGTAFGLPRRTLESFWKWRPGDRSPSYTSAESELELQTDSLGHVRFTSYFDGNSLRRLRRSGPWTFCCSFRRAGPFGDGPSGSGTVSENLSVLTRPWTSADFARRYQGELDPYHGAYFESRTPAELVYALGLDLIAATIVSADSQGTIAAPPRVRLRIEEGLYGSLAPGEVSVVWSGGSLDLICTVGEEERIARWNSMPLRAPGAGSKWILGCRRDKSGGQLVSVAFARWAWTDSLRADFVLRSREWPATLRVLRKEAAALERAHRRAAQAEFARAERLANRRRVAKQREAARDLRATRVAERRIRRLLADQQSEAVRTWRRTELVHARTANFDSLASASSIVVVAEMHIDRVWRSGAVRVRVLKWLRAPDGWLRPRELLVRYDDPEGPLLRRWARPPVPAASRAGRVDTLRCVAFLRGAWDPHSYSERPYCRIVDPKFGLLIADPPVLARVTSALRRHADPPAGPVAGCTAPLAEFAHLSEAEASGVALKWSDTSPSTNWPGQPTLLLGCFASDATPAAEEFASCTLPVGRTFRDQAFGAFVCRVSPATMRALLDSLTHGGAAWASRRESGDSLSVTLRRVVAGRERVFECTLDRASFARLTSLVAPVFDDWNPPHDPEAASATGRATRTALRRWTSALDPSLEAVWEPPGEHR